MAKDYVQVAKDQRTSGQGPTYKWPRIYVQIAKDYVHMSKDYLQVAKHLRTYCHGLRRACCRHGDPYKYTHHYSSAYRTVRSRRRPRSQPTHPTAVASLRTADHATAVGKPLGTPRGQRSKPRFANEKSKWAQTRGVSRVGKKGNQTRFPFRVHRFESLQTRRLPSPAARLPDDDIGHRPINLSTSAAAPCEPSRQRQKKKDFEIIEAL